MKKDQSMFDWDLAMQMYENGAYNPEIADALGCSVSNVSLWLKRNSLKSNYKKNQLSTEKQNEILDMLRSGMTCGEVEDKSGVFRETVRKVGKRNGVAVQNVRRMSSADPDKTCGIIDRGGYILLRVDVGGPYDNLIRAKNPNRTRGYALLHRMRMQDHLGRKLLDSEVVHHIDGDIYNNSIQNLKLYHSNGDHLADTLKGKCPNWTDDGKKRILASVSRKRHR